MEGGNFVASGGGGGGGGGPAPFLLKTYDMVDDSSTDDIVSWSASETSFVVWNPPDFAARLLPTYFKHNNFSSFIRQLNTYGFRKIDPERWEFANEEFVKGQKHLLKNIHRRKPIHSHSHPPGSLTDSERAALEEEIDRLTRERTALQTDLWRFKQHQSATKIQLDDLERRMADMEERQVKLITFLQRAVQNPRFVENIVKMAGASPIDFSAIHKKRRLPGTDYGHEASENSFYDDHCSTSKTDLGHLFNQDFCDKLKLELCPAMSASNLVSLSNQSSNEVNGCLQEKQPDCSQLRMDCPTLVPDTLELSDTGASICPAKNLLFPRMADEGDGLFPCHLNLTLASCSMQVESGQGPSGTPISVDQGAGTVTELRTPNASRESDLGMTAGYKNSSAADPGECKATSLQQTTPASDETPVAPQGRVNDVFWEQFLTERPGSSDTEEASSCLRTDHCDDQHEERRPGNENMWRERTDMERLTL